MQKLIEQTTETVRYIASSGRSYDISVIVTGGISPLDPLPILLKEEDDELITAVYRDAHEEQFSTISQAIGYHGGFVVSFKAIELQE